MVSDEGFPGFSPLYDEYGTSGKTWLPKQSERSCVSEARLVARDNWNIDDIHVRELFVKYDRYSSGALGKEELNEFLRDFNGRQPTPHEIDFMLRVSDEDRDGVISLGELHYAMLAWHCYQTFDVPVLQHFADFDWGYPEILEESVLEDLLIKINDGMSVRPEEVRTVMRQAGSEQGLQINRANLLGAVAAWYGHVLRKDTAMGPLMQEAINIGLKEHDQVKQLMAGTSDLNTAWSHLQSSHDGYQQVGGGPMGSRPNRSRSNSDNETPEAKQERRAGRVRAAMPFLAKSIWKFTHLGLRFVFSLILTIVGLCNRCRECQHDLGLLLVWFGVLSFSHSIMYFNKEPVVAKAQIAVGNIMAVLTVVGIKWTTRDDVECSFIVCFSLSVWFFAAIISVMYAGYVILSQWRRLELTDQNIQKGGLLVV